MDEFPANWIDHLALKIEYAVLHIYDSFSGNTTNNNK